MSTGTDKICIMSGNKSCLHTNSSFLWMVPMASIRYKIRFWWNLISIIYICRNKQVQKSRLQYTEKQRKSADRLYGSYTMYSSTNIHTYILQPLEKFEYVQVSSRKLDKMRDFFSWQLTYEQTERQN